MTYAETIKFVVAMIIMMNPLGSLSIFTQLTKKFSLYEKRKTATTCYVAMTIAMLVTLWIGQGLLDLLGITIASFRCAGGIILLLVGLAMLQSQESPLSHTPEDDQVVQKSASIAIVPMALPTIIGPGTISTLIIASNDYPIFVYKAWLSILCCLLALFMGLILYYSEWMVKTIGPSMVKVITRIMGMIIMAIAAGMFTSGLVGLIPALQH